MNKLLKNKYLLFAVALVAGVAIGYLIKPENKTAESDVHNHASESTTYTCSMHPQIRQNEPGQCPICGMDLVPVDKDDTGIDPMAVSMSESTMILAGVRTSIVGTGDKTKTINLNGKIQPDETMMVSQATHIPGRVEALYVDFTGEYIKRGQILARIYSPELVTAQQELFTAKKYENSQPNLLKSAKEKLRNWKLSQQQINTILETGKPIDNFPITADVSGYVVNKNVSLGDYLNKGQNLYKIADLSKVWVLFDVYEQDLAWIDEGDQVSFTVSSIPGKTFNEKIEYIDPVIDPATRVAKARLEVKNPDLKFKPEMFVSGKVKSQLNTDGSVLTVSMSAVMWTGERSVVYVKSITDQGVSFRMREVTLGHSLGDAYVIKEGLEEGEEIATSGTFSIDAAAQLAGKPSMMDREGGASMKGHQHGEVKTANAPAEIKKDLFYTAPEAFKNQIKSVYNAYLPVKNALVNSDANSASNKAEGIMSALNNVDMKLVKGDAHDYWMELLDPMKEASQKMTNVENLELQREALIPLTNNLVKAIKTYEVNGLKGFYQYCPMADNNKGAYWLSAEDDVKNPYFGDAMLTCGEVVETIGN